MRAPVATGAGCVEMRVARARDLNHNGTESTKDDDDGDGRGV
jgi:hypothetical protein